MKKLLTLILVGALALSLVSLGACTSSNSENSTHTTSDSRVSYQGKTLTVVLDENPTTAYLWSFEIDGKNVKAAEEEYTADEVEEGIAGSGGKHSFSFEGVSEGTAQIEFICSRSWETNPNDERLTIEVTTDSSGTINEVKTH